VDFLIPNRSTNNKYAIANFALARHGNPSLSDPGFVPFFQLSFHLLLILEGLSLFGFFIFIIDFFYLISFFLGFIIVVF